MENPSVPTYEPLLAGTWLVAALDAPSAAAPGARRPMSGDRDRIVGTNPKLLLLGAGSYGRRTAVVTITVLLPLRLDRSLNDNTEASDR